MFFLWFSRCHFLASVCLQAAFHVVRFAIKLRSFSRLHQLKHITRDDDGEVKPAMEPTESDDDLMSSEVETIRSSEEPQLTPAHSLESCQNCVSAGQEENEEAKLTEKGVGQEDGEEVEHMHQAIGSLARLALEALEGSGANLKGNSQVDSGVSCLRVNTATSPVCGFVESITTNRCRAAEHHVVCSHSSNGDTLSTPANHLEDASGSADQASLLSSNSDLVLGFSDLVHLMHACRCNGDASAGHEQEGTVPADSDKAESNHLLVLNSEQGVEALSQRVQCTLREVATSGGVTVTPDDFKQVKEWEEDSEQEEEVTALHSTRKEVESVEDEEMVAEGRNPAARATKGGMEVSKSSGTEDTSAMPIMDAWEMCDTSKPERANSCSKVPPLTDHQVNALELESSGQTDSSPAASPSALWSNECD